MAEAQKLRDQFVEGLSDRQLGVFLAHERQPSCDAAMQEHLTVKQYRDFLKVTELQQAEDEASIPPYPPFLDEIMHKEQVENFRQMASDNKWKVLDAWMSQFPKHTLKYYNWKNRVLAKKTIESHKSADGTCDKLAENFKSLALQSSTAQELPVADYKSSPDGSIKILITVKGDVSGHIIGPQGRTVKGLAQDCGAAVNVVRAYGSTLVNLTSRSKEQLIRAQLMLWTILSTAQAAIFKREIEDVSVWREKADSDKADFQGQYSTSVTDYGNCLKIATFHDELAAAAEEALRSKPKENQNRWTPLLPPEDLKLTIVIYKKGIIGYLIGKGGKTVEWVRDKFDVQMKVTETSDATLVRLIAKEKTKLLEAEFDIWKSLGKIQNETECTYDKNIINLWNNIWNKEEKMRLMNRTNTFITHVEDMGGLLIKGFTSDAVKTAASKLKTLLDTGMLPSEDDKKKPQEAGIG